MNLMGRLFAFRMSRRIETIVAIDKNQEEKFLQSLQEPQNDLERSFNQYLCQKYNANKRHSFFYDNFFLCLVYSLGQYGILNTISFFDLMFYSLLFSSTNQQVCHKTIKE